VAPFFRTRCRIRSLCVVEMLFCSVQNAVCDDLKIMFFSANVANQTESNLDIVICKLKAVYIPLVAAVESAHHPTELQPAFYLHHVTESNIFFFIFYLFVVH